MGERLSMVGRRVRALFRRRQLEQDLTDEVAFHLALREEQLRGAGMADALRGARRQFGSVARVREDLRSTWALAPRVGAFVRDVRYAARSLRRQPGFTVVVVLALGLGIGANTAAFSVINGVLLEPLRYPRSGELVSIVHTAPGAPAIGQGKGMSDLPESVSMFFTYADGNRTFSSIGLWQASFVSVTDVAEPEQVRSVSVSQGTLETIAVQPVLGRWFSEDDQTPGTPETVLLSYEYWQRRFGGDESVLGRRLTVQSIPREIIGVMPRGFRLVSAAADVIVPFRFDRTRLFLFPFNFQTVARLRPGVTMAEANADLARLVPVWLNGWPVPAGFGLSSKDFESWDITPSARPLRDEVVGNVASVLWVVMATLGIVLLIACANVANLSLIRAEGRQRELALRSALGAGSWRLVRQGLVESLLLGLAGGALGVGLAYGGLGVLLAMGPADLPRLHEIAIDARTLAFTVVVSLLSGLLFGLLPAMKSLRASVQGTLGGGGRTQSQSRERRRTHQMLVVAQVALALVLLVASGLMIRTFGALRSVDPGFTGASELQTMRITIPFRSVSEPERVTRMQHDIVERLATIPGVTSVAFSSAMPMEGLPPNISPLLVEQPAHGSAASPGQMFKFVSPGYFQTLGTAVIAGREFTWTDLNELRPVGIVSENLARQLWGTPAEALGKRIRSVPTKPWREVVGVVADVRELGLHEAAPTLAYWPTLMDSLYEPGTAATRAVTFTLRSAQAGTETLLSQVRQAVWSVSASLPVASTRTLQGIHDESMARTSFTLVMLTVVGAMALVLGVVGIYGAISYAATERRREIGIRLALGAQPFEIRRTFLRQGLTLAGIGGLIGVGAALGLTRMMETLLFEVSAVDPLTYLSVTLVLTGAAALASYIPAWRASRRSPVEVLGVE